MSTNKIKDVLNQLEVLLHAHKEQPSVTSYYDICEYLVEIEEAAEELIIEYME